MVQNQTETTENEFRRIKVQRKKNATNRKHLAGIKETTPCLQQRKTLIQIHGNELKGNCPR